MGYTTEFSGAFKLDKPLTAEHKAYIEAFSRTRRMKRDAAKTSKMKDPIRIAAGLPVGTDGGYYVGGNGEDFGQARTSDIVNYNSSPSGQPGLWCQWIPTEDGTEIEWDGGEKFYNYTEWIEYIITNFLAPWGYKLNGEVEWSGEESDDRGMIRISDNEVKVLQGRIVYE